jgi:hypothetical protein
MKKRWKTIYLWRKRPPQIEEVLQEGDKCYHKHYSVNFCEEHERNKMAAMKKEIRNKTKLSQNTKPLNLNLE